MARRRNSHGFSALKVEGGLLPPEFLQTVAALDAKQQAVTDYGLSTSLNLKDELARYWRIANDLWAAYDERRGRQDVDPHRVGVTDWLVRFLHDVLGYEDIQRAGPPLRIGERQFPVSHTACGGAVPLVLTTQVYDLDRADPAFGEEGRRRQPHGLMQEYLNAEDDCLWGLVANGGALRLLRDNPSLTRPAHVEADLELIFRDQLFPDFAALWLLVHATRLRPQEAGKPASCIMEVWRNQAHETGERALANLREGVADALRYLGSGFLQHPDNQALRAAIGDGTLEASAYYQELLRLVYRLLFLFTAEDRDLVHEPGAGDTGKRLYADGYSVGRLRERAGRRRYYDRHGDLWQGLGVTFRALAQGAPELGLPALGGLFSQNHCPQLDAAELPNEHLLHAIRSLTFFRTGDALARVNYRDMGTEELGSVYEALLELHPRIDVDTSPWQFGFVSDLEGETTRGTDRKLSGSYYTPAALVNELIKSALEPVLERTVKESQSDPQDAILRLRVVDPACGSGHFLLAAARRMAAELARIEAGPDTPDETTRQHALREVVRHCMYGVDRNPLAVELCRTALWIETVEPGKPLAFLDPHIRCGDSLIGVLDPDIMRGGIPKEAYKPLTGDDKQVCSELRKRNREAGRSVQGDLFDRGSLQEMASWEADLDGMPEDTVDEVEAKRRAWEDAQSSFDREREAFRANLYVGAFFAPKTRDTADLVPLTEDLKRIDKGLAPRAGMRQAVEQLAQAHAFFHWPLEFPEVMRRDGFDVVLGNPPWERIKLQEQEFFANRSPAIAQAPNKAARERLIKSLKQSDAARAERALYWQFEQTRREAEAASQFIRAAGRYPLTGVGDVNTYAVFAESFMRLISQRGRAGLIVPTGIATDNSTKAFFEEVSTKGHLVSLYDFENRERLFPAVDSRMKFALLTLGHNVPEAYFAFFATRVENLQNKDARFTLTPNDVLLLNPNTKTCPVFRSNADAELTKKIYSRVPVLVDETKGPDGNPWGVEFMRMFDMSNDSGLFRTYAQLEAAGVRREGMNWVDAEGETWVPLYEAKMINMYDHRFGSYEARGNERGYRVLPETTLEQYRDPYFDPIPFYYINKQDVIHRLGIYQREWLYGFKDVTSPTNERTFISAFFRCVGQITSSP